jgi:two-component system NtrC family response regulator
MESNDYSHMKVVLIDDDQMVAQSLQSALKEFGFLIVTFNDPRKGLEWIAQNGVDIVLSDIRMPQCDGFEVLKRAKELDPHCDVIFITAHGQMDTAVRALREGATDFFEKPFTMSALCAAMERTKRFRILSQQKEILTDQVSALSHELANRNRSVMLARSEAMKKVAADIVDLAVSNATILIIGESGTGKELVANAIHRASPREKKPFLTLNCPSVPEELFESEMFGHRKGSYTGAVETRSGYVEAAEGGTLFLDEVGDLPLKSQSKILRFLEQKTYLPVGEHKEREADVRVIAATNQSLENLVKEKNFREDLFYRLSVCTIQVPPLRERREDIPLLSLYFVLRFASEMGKAIEGIDNDALWALSNHDYPGNIRELRNIIESSVIRCKHSGMLGKEDLAPLMPTAQNKSPPPPNLITSSLKFEDVERNLYQEALNRTDSNVSAAARILGLSRGKLRRRLSALNLHYT